MSDLKSLKEELAAACREWGLKGTILLSPEGINLFVAGEEHCVDALVDRLRALPGMNGLEPKRSWSEHQPFNRMLVRIKKEIISFGVESVRPAEYTSPKLAPAELKKWLDEGRPVTLLDTRNDYEVRLGTFRGAVDPEIKTFREFPQAVRKLPEGWKEAPIVMFCTGGIRCEKAGPFMEAEGFRQIYQLDGGILKYFEECGGDHFDGDCFVFDQRVGVDPALRETEHAVCFVCQTPLDAEDQEDPRYVSGSSCPHCYREEPELRGERIRLRQQRIDQICEVLPGSQAEEIRRPVHIPAHLDGVTLLEALSSLFPHMSADVWRERCAQGRLVNYRGDARSCDYVVRAGERVLQIFPPEREPDVAKNIRVIDEDESVVVVDKPAPLPMHSGGRFHRNTLQHLLALAYAPYGIRMVHRLDANTTGVVVLARTRHVARRLARQFVENRVGKIYLVRVLGHPEADHLECDAPIQREPDIAGTRQIGGSEDDQAFTQFHVLHRWEDGTSLLQAEPRTGRTHQIRLHLHHLGYPVVGDPSYGNEPSVGMPATLAVGDPPMMLHAWKLEMDHPRTGERVTWEASPPDWANREA